MSDSSPFGDLTTYELLCGSDETNNISPIKFTALSNKTKTGNYLFFNVLLLSG